MAKSLASSFRRPGRTRHEPDRWIGSTLAIGLLFAAISQADAAVLHESAVLGPGGQTNGFELSDQLLGSRFTIERTVRVDAIGGHLARLSDATVEPLFGAIISLAGPDALPVGDPSQVFANTTIAATTFVAPFPSEDFFVALSATLSPGDYALVFGSGQFGATGTGFMPFNNTEIPGQASYFSWNPGLGTWVDGGEGGGLPRQTRFVVTGVLVPGGSFKCYKAKLPPGERFPRQRVELLDQFGTSSVLLFRPSEICNPVDKDDEGIQDPQAHLLCYRVLERRRGGKREIRSMDQFGTQELTLAGTREICLPAVKNGDGELEDIEGRTNHYQCYQARTARGATPPDPPDVTLSDQFESKVTDVRKTSLFCNPLLQKDDEDLRPIPQPETHLTCYDIRDAPDQPRFAGRVVTIEDQFGMNRVRVGRATRLCEEASKELLN